MRAVRDRYHQAVDANHAELIRDQAFDSLMTTMVSIPNPLPGGGGRLGQTAPDLRDGSGTPEQPSSM